MSDETNVVQFPGAKATDTLVPQVIKVTIGEGEDVETYVLATFCLAKTIRTFALLSELAQAVGVSEAVSAAGEAGVAAEGMPAPGFITKILAILPRALSEGQPALFRLLGLLVTGNAKLRRMDENGEDIDSYLYSLGRDISWRGTNDQFIDLLLKSVKVIGVESIVKNLPALMGLIGGRS